MAETANLATDNKGHGLLCPACKVDLVMSERQGIEIDYCPKCRGVWLDRGELDKIIERSVGAEAQGQSAQSSPPQERYYDERGGHGGYGKHGGSRHGHGYKRSFLRELFD